LRHFDRAVGGHGAVDAGKQLDMRDAARGAEADRRARHLPAAELLGALSVKLEDPGVEVGPAPRLNQSSIWAVEWP
jgi:hypothetical protein